MKKIILPVLIVLFLAACEEKVDVKRIQWTSSSPEAIKLFEKFQMNYEIEYDNPFEQEDLLDSILVLDPNFIMAKASYFNFGGNEKNRKHFLEAYENKMSLSEIEKDLIETYNQAFIKGNIVKQDSLLDLMVEKYPDFYQLRLFSGSVKNNIDIRGCQKRWEEALEINPQSFSAILNLAKLHFPVIASFKMLSIDDRDPKIAENYLNQGLKLYPESSRWTRYLGNLYRSQGKLKESKEAYEKASKIIEKNEGGKKSYLYSEIIYLIGHVNLFLEKYDEARNAYKEHIELENNIRTTVFIGVFKSHTYIYQKDYTNSIYLLSDIQSKIAEDDQEDELFKMNLNQWIEFQKFLTFGHSQKKEETFETIERINKIIDQRDDYFINLGIEESEILKRKTDSKAGKIDLKIWYNILFGEYEQARINLEKYNEITDKQLSYNPRAKIEYNKYIGYINLMEGNPIESVNAYSQVPEDVLTDDNYHMYFFGLAKKATGDELESQKIFVELANDNFAGWQNAFVKNLAKRQVKANL